MRVGLVFLSICALCTICICVRITPSKETPKLCDPNHSNSLMFLCLQDNTFICKECAGLKHYDHLHALKSLSSKFYTQLPEFLDLKGKIELLKEFHTHSNTTKTLLMNKISEAYDEFEQNIKNNREEWIQHTYQKILGMNNESKLEIDIYQNLSDLKTEVDTVYDSLQNIATTKFDNFSSDDMTSLAMATEFDIKFTELNSISLQRKEINKIEVNLTFDLDLVDKMITIKNIPNTYLYSRYNTTGGSILNLTEFNFILEELPHQLNELELLYIGSQNNFSIKGFHTNCDGKANTLVIVKAENGNVFGGFAAPSWVNTGNYVLDEVNESFLFTCRTKSKHMLKVSSKDMATAGDPKWGPTFGRSKSDLHIDTKTGVTNLGHSYILPKGSQNEDFLAGVEMNKNFNILEYEVYHLIFED